MAEKRLGMVQVVGDGTGRQKSLKMFFFFFHLFRLTMFFSVKVVILAGLGVVAVGSFPPFAEEICNRFTIPANLADLAKI